MAVRDSAYNPPVELPSSSASNFFEEASAGPAEEAECRRRFDRFATKPGNEPDFLSFSDFIRLMEHYEATPISNLVSFFYAIDRNRDHKLDFEEFFLGSVAADPLTVHILNSFTGRERAAFTFDYYDANRSGFLELEEFQKVCRDCAIPTLEEPQLRRHTFDKAMELGLMQERRGRIMDEEQSFMPPSHSQFYDFISSERLRGTSRLFRFGKSMIKTRQPRRLDRDGDDATTNDPSDSEDNSWVGFDSEGSPSSAAQDLETLLPYTDLLPAAPDCEMQLDMQKGLSDARSIAGEVLKGLSHPHFKGMAPPQDGSFTLATADEICGLCNAAVEMMRDEEMVTNLTPPLKVFGALHGQMWDLLSHFKWHLPPVMDMGGDIAYMRYLFLGDYCDRGSYNLEVLTILLALKVLNRDKVFLLRGHHENRHVNYHLGLREECVRRLGPCGPEVYEQLNRTFEHMSLAAVVLGKLLALGPGILPTSLHRLDQLKKYKKPLYLPHPLQRHSEKAERLNEQVLLELFTPSDLLPELAATEREGDQVKAFCATHKLNVVVSGRQIPPCGFAYDPASRLIRVCSCLNYCNLPPGNMAAILYIVLNEESDCAFTIRPKVLAAFADGTDFLDGRPQTSHQNPSRWPLQERAPTPGRFRGVQMDEQSLPAIHVLEDQAVAAVEDGPVALYFPVAAFA